MSVSGEYVYASPGQGQQGQQYATTVPNIQQPPGQMQYPPPQGQQYAQSVASIQSAGQYAPPQGQQYPRQGSIGSAAVPSGFPPIKLKIPPVPYFSPKDNQLFIPQADGRGFSAMPAYKLSSDPTYNSSADGLRESIKQEVMRELRRDFKQNIRQEIVLETRQESASKEAALETRWYELPGNTFGAAIWAILVLEIDALNPMYLAKGRDNANVPFHQQWKQDGGFNDIKQWFAKRLFPFLSSIFFQFTTIGLAIASVLLQFGFTYMLDMQIGNQSFFDLENSKYICGTSGWVQLISVGFFLTFMFGQLPQIFKNYMIILLSTKETDDDRGQDQAKKLFIAEQVKNPDGTVAHKQVPTPDQLISESKYLPAELRSKVPEHEEFTPRTRFNHFWRQFFSLVFPSLEFAEASYLVYVGVKYIFWSGFSSLEQPQSGSFPSFDAGDDDEYPWMSNTQGVEEIIMATLALQFIMEIDEGVFTYVLPRSIQNSVISTKLSGDYLLWLPAKFKLSDYTNLGNHMKKPAVKKAAPPAPPGDAAFEPSADDDDDEDEDQPHDWLGYFKYRVLRQQETTVEKAVVVDPREAGAAGGAKTKTETVTGIRQHFGRKYDKELAQALRSAVYCNGKELYEIDCELKKRANNKMLNLDDPEYVTEFEEPDADYDFYLDRPEQYWDTAVGDWRSAISQYTEWTLPGENQSIADMFDSEDPQDAQKLKEWAGQWDQWDYSQNKDNKDFDRDLLRKVYAFLHRDAFLKSKDKFRNYMYKDIFGSDDKDPTTNPVIKATAKEIFDNKDIQKADQVRYEWLGLLPDATFLFTWAVVFTPIFLVLLIRAKAGCFAFEPVPLNKLPAKGIDYWEGVGILTVPFIIVAVIGVLRLLRLLGSAGDVARLESDLVKSVEHKKKKLKRKNKTNTTIPATADPAVPPPLPMPQQPAPPAPPNPGGFQNPGGNMVPMNPMQPGPFTGKM